MAYALFLVNKKEVVFFPLLRRKKNIFPRKKKKKTSADDYKFRIKNQWFVTGTFSYVTGKFAEIATATFRFSRAFF